jgi:hypothetical protein
MSTDAFVLVGTAILYWLQNHWLIVSGLLMFVGATGVGGLLWIHATQLKRSISNAYVGKWEIAIQQTENKSRYKWISYIELHMTSLYALSPRSSRVAAWLLVGVSGMLGVSVGLKAHLEYKGLKGTLPYNELAAWMPFVVGLFASALPFLLLHTIVQAKRVKLSHDLLVYVEEFERQYLALGAPKPALESLIAHTKGPLRELTYRLVHALQRNRHEQILEILILLEHQIATRFAHVFAVLLRESIGIGAPYGKDIKVGLRALIEKMHLQRQTQAADQPKKRELSQVGLLTFPVLYGGYYFGSEILAERAQRYLFDAPGQLNLWMGALLMGMFACCMNLIAGKRKLDL